MSSFAPFEDEFAPGYYADRRGYASKYYAQDDQYYYDDPANFKYDKKRGDWQREDSRDYHSRKEAGHADKYKEDIKTEDYFASKYTNEQAKKTRGKAAHPDVQPITHRGGRGERGAARGARGAPVAAKEPVHAYSRGKQLTQENFQFKVKEKDTKNESTKRSDDRSADSGDKHDVSNDNVAETGREEQKQGEYIYVKKRPADTASTAANVEVLDQLTAAEEGLPSKNEQPTAVELQDGLEQASSDEEDQRDQEVEGDQEADREEGEQQATG